MALLKTNTGIGITNPSAALHVIGDGLFIGIVSATTFYGNLGGGVQGSVPYQSAINSTTFLSPGSPGQVLVTGGSGQNPYWSPASSLVGSFSGITIKDEGTLVGSALSVSSLNFVGNNIVATASGADATITLYNDAQYLTGTAPASVISQSNGLNVTGSVNISGNLSVGGTSVILNAATLQIKDKDIVLGITTNALNQDISTDLSASHGGISIASTEGSPLINFPIEVGINSNPSTYKQLMWIKAGGYSGMGTDAWVSNYAISIGNTSTVANGSRLTVGTGFTVYDNLLYTRNIYSTGIITATQFVGSFSGNITGIASYATYSGIATYATSSGIATYATTSGVSTSVIGGIGSLTQLQVTGISTFSNGPVFIGAATSTGTTSQPLQVTGGAYVSGNLGIGVTNPLYPLDLDTRLYVKSRTEGGDGSTGIDISSGVSTGIITRAHRIRTAGGGGGTLAIEAVSTGVGTGGGRINFVTNDTVRVAISSLGTLLVGGSIADQNIIGSAATTTLLQVTGDSYISGNLGIGSINPSSKLSVVGNVLISGIVTANNLTSQTLSVAGISTFTNGPVFIGAATSTGTASQPLQVTGGAYVSGNLGIGTTSPQAKLHLVGDTLVTGITTSSWKGSEGTLFSIINNLSTGSIFSVCDISGIPSIDVDANGTIAIAPYGNNLSKVGIGTTSPTSKLTVIGDVLVSGVITATAFIGNIATAGIASTAINLQGGDASQLAYQVSPGITSFIANGTSGYLLKSNGTGVPTWVNPALGFNVDTANYALKSGISTSVIGGIGSLTQLQVTGISTFTDGPVFIGAATSTGTASQRLQVTGGAYVSGNLGIGTTTPQAKLTISGALRTQALGIGSEFIVSDTGSFVPSVSIAATIGSGTTEKVLLRSISRNQGTLDVVSNYRQTQMMNVSDTNSEGVFRVTALETSTVAFVAPIYRQLLVVGESGIVTTRNAVAIATANATGVGGVVGADIYGNVNIRSPFSTSTSYVAIAPNFRDNGALSFEAPIGAASTNSITQLFSITNNVSSSIFRINDLNRNPIFEANVAGNIGIGTTSPQRKLEIQGITRITSVGSTANEQIDIRHYRNISGFATVGMGSTSFLPTNNSGAISFESPVGYSSFTASLFALINDPNGSIFSVAGFNPQRFASDPRVPALEITQSGNIGIGTTNPVSKFHIIGNTRNIGNIGIGTIIVDTSRDFTSSSGVIQRLSTQIAGAARITSLGSTTLSQIDIKHQSNPGINTLAPSRGALFFDGLTDTFATNVDGGQLVTITNDNTSSIFAVNRFVPGVAGLSSANPTNTRTIETVVNVTSGGNVGIGTSIPSSRLDIRGNVLVSGIVTATTFSGNFIGTVTSSGVSTSVIGGIGSLTQLQVTGISTFTNGPVFIGAATSTGTASQPLQVTGGAYVSGNLGVGITNPLAYGTASPGNYKIVATGLGTFGYNFLTGNTTVSGKTGYQSVMTSFAVSGGKDVVINGNTSGRMRINIAWTNATGNAVGYMIIEGSTYINSSGSGYTLSNYRIVDKNFQGGTFYNVTENPDVAVTSPAGNTSADKVTLTIRGADGQGSLYATVQVEAWGSYLTDANGAISLSTPGTTTSTSYLSDVRTFWTSNNERGRFDASGNLLVGILTATGTASQRLQVTGGAYVSGNLGIGTTNPTSTLHVVGNISGTNLQGASQVLNFDTIKAPGLYHYDGSFGGTIPPPTTANYRTIEIGSANRFSQIAMPWSSNDMYLRRNTDGAWSSWSTVLSSSNYSTYSSFSNLIVAGISTFTNGPVIIGAATSTGTASQRLQVTGGAYVSGNLGIGTTNPQSTLHVVGNVLVAAGASTDQYITLKPYELSNGTLSWEGSAGQLFSITNSLTSGSIFSVNDISGIPSIDVDASGAITLGAYGGNIGVGTANPTSKLHVVGDARVGINTSQGIILTSPNGTKYRLIVSDAGTVSTVLVV